MSKEALDYDQWIHLDAEALAEQGIAFAYRELLPQLCKFIAHPVDIEESFDPDIPTYSVRAGSFSYVIYSPTLRAEEADSWGRASYAFFQCVNAQLQQAPVRLYAINGGNDLGGLFLTPAQAQAARSSLPRKLDWPYLPMPDSPWYGQFH